MAKYLVTGGAGFIGSNIARALVKQGDGVRIIDNLSNGKLSNLEAIASQVDFQEIDIRNLEAVREACQGVDYVLHQAALGSVPRSIDDPIASNASNIDGTLNVLVAARDAGVKRLVYAASSSVYGSAPVALKHEELPPNPISPYALTKYVGEVYSHQFTQYYQLSTICLRYFNVFGPYQRPDSQYAAVIPRFITAMLKGEQPEIYGDGEQSRDFTFISNTVQANLLAALSKEGAGQSMNIACGASISLNQIVQEINAILGTSIQPVYKAERVGDVRNSLASIEKAKNLLHYTPIVTFKEGLKQTIEWYQQNLP